MGNGVVPASVQEPSEDEQLQALGGTVTVAAFAERLAAAGKASVTVVCGAGISVSAGIPDFRSPGTGLYDNLQKYNLPTPESIFTLDYFKEHPLPFFQLAKEMYPGNFAPTPTHAFIKLLQDKKVLRRVFTQNIDTLERLVGIKPSLLVEAHGSFSQAHCLDCKAAHESEWVRQEIVAERVPVRCPECGGLVKPDIVFFGEGLPKRFGMLLQADVPEAELLIVMGTSLKVQPFASTVNAVGPLCPRLLINNEVVGLRDASGHGLRLDAYDNYRDVALLASCDDGVCTLAHAAGWGAEFAAAVEGLGESFPTSGGQQQACEALGEEALGRSWCRCLVGPLPTLLPTVRPPAAEGDSTETRGEARIQLLTALSANTLSSPPATAPAVMPADDAASESTCASMPELVPVLAGDSDIKETASVRPPELPPATAPESAAMGGQTLEFEVELPGASLHSDGRHCSIWLGIVPCGATTPSRVFERVEVGTTSDAEPPQSLLTTVSLTVPPLKRKQLQDREAPVYEVWLVRELTEASGSAEGHVLARIGPLHVAPRNAEGVGVANRFALMAARSAIRKNAEGEDSSLVQGNVDDSASPDVSST